MWQAEKLNKHLINVVMIMEFTSIQGGFNKTSIQSTQ
jgi:hypothetical protein